MASLQNTFYQNKKGNKLTPKGNKNIMSTMWALGIQFDRPEQYKKLQEANIVPW